MEHSSIEKVFQQSFRSNLIFVFVVLFLSFCALVSVYIFNEVAETERDAIAYLKRNEDYLLGLALYNNHEAIQTFLDDSKKKLFPVTFELSISDASSGTRFPLSIGGQNYGSILVRFDLWEVVNWRILFLFLLLASAVFFTSFRFYRMTQNLLRRNVITPLSELGSIIQSSSQFSDLYRLSSVDDHVHEIREVKKHIVQSTNLLIKNEEALREAELSKALHELASKVAHDIQSPVSALRMISEEAKDLPGELSDILKGSIDRIQSIASDLTKRNKMARLKDASPEGMQTSAGISALVERLLVEKRAELGRHSQISIDYHAAPGAIQAYAKLDENLFLRVLSNVINNSIEALEDRTRPQIQVLVRLSDELVEILVRDNGKGVPDHVLSRLGEKNFSYGKDSGASGSGLGLYSAREALREWGGSLKVTSQLGIGTEVIISLPLLKNQVISTP